ncbi:hypothetical protein [Thermaerobacillus caldiproteolyticus]|uniref:hypothetical protein n=1 Tax=Thermaerobacillus caldiproteolyticus TaxID=247480 RepID=UPI0018F13B33|nr:hypothetical protein [Anoxybacillus caldiproteolyticus]
MKLFWFVLSLIPIPFLFHFYEYGQHIKGNEAPFLMFGFILSMIIVGVLSKNIRVTFILLMNLVTTIVSVILTSKFIPNDGYWFTVVGRDGAVIFIAIIYLIGQLFVRMIARVNNKK